MRFKMDTPVLKIFTELIQHNFSNFSNFGYQFAPFNFRPSPNFAAQFGPFNFRLPGGRKLRVRGGEIWWE